MAKGEGVGRPTKYDVKHNEQVYKLCLLGATVKDIADFFAVDEATIYRWQNEYPAFCESVKSGKEQADANVAKSLYQRATGYKCKEDKIFLHEGQPVVVPTEKQYAPDTTAVIFWLKNRQRDKWRDVNQQEISAPGGGPLEVSFVSGSEE